ncbi:alkyl hydroperoxide reductase subunit F [Janibacter cremeus]|uniref:Alkyl hydroperoxide reductase subunit F n=1 Tax=Janibacter cremeus TaxID=1285192 RepID=A0A852VR80_9MICO|nr:alkyl hydroperoxide reductase subunit F [Janibacter cremeus]NYF98449.1 alkyl hydroperoxide reductase subunit F [Janibacter cremeus]
MALDPNLATQLTAYLENLREPIELVATLDDGAKSIELDELLVEIAGMSELITRRVVEGAERDERVPSFAITRTGAPEVSVRFAGIPMGHEFTSLVLALLQVGGHPSKASQDVLDQIRGLTGVHKFETFFSLSCQNCPDVVQALNLMSVLNPDIEHVAIDGAVFPDEADARGVMAVPTVFHNGENFGSGRMELPEIVAKVDELSGGDAAERAAQELNAREPYEVLVVGGGPAGASAAIYAARKGIRTGIVADRVGGQVLDTMSIENLVSVPHTEGPKLAADLERHMSDYDIDLVRSQQAAGLSEGRDGLTMVDLAGGAALSGKTVVLATGARWRTMGVPGEEEYRNKGVTFCPHCDGPLFKGKDIAVIGGGNSGVEAAIDLAGIVGHVTLIEFLDEMRADEVLQRKVHSLPNVDVRLGTKTTEVIGDGGKVTGIAIEPRDGGQGEQLDVEGVFVQIGLLPNTEWLGDAVELSERGEVVIDGVGRTNLPGVFAAGDCTIEPYKQIVTALGAGSTASLSAFDHLIRSSAPSEEAAMAATKVADGPIEAGDQIDVPDSVGANA